MVGFVSLEEFVGKRRVIAYVNSQGSDKPAHLGSLARSLADYIQNISAQ